MTAPERGERYALVTAAHNEERFIEATIRAVLGQTVPPIEWHIVSDASTDRTDAIVRDYASTHPQIRFCRVNRLPGRGFGNKGRAIQVGFDGIRNIPVEYIGNIDADITFSHDYFEMLLREFTLDESLGIAGGWIYECEAAVFAPRPFNAIDTVPHATQLIRHACYRDIGDYVILEHGGEDTCAGILAEMHGWKVRAFPSLPTFHHRLTGKAGPTFAACFRNGLREQSLGYHPLFQFVKCVTRLQERPYAIHSALRFAGYWYGMLSGQPRPVPSAFVAFLRQRQRERLRMATRRNLLDARHR